MKLLALLVLSVSILHAKCAKILGVFPAPGYSQFILAEVLMNELANRGHHVTVIAPYTPKNAHPNYKTIETENALTSGDGIDLFQLEQEDLFTNIKTTYLYGNVITENTLKNEKVQKLLNSNENFDVVIVEQFFNDAMKGFATHFNAPLILFSSMGLTEWNRDVMGIPALPSINPISYTSYTSDMNIYQRFRNLIGTIFDCYYRNWVATPIQKEYLKKYFPKAMDFDQILYNSSLMLLNSHVTTSENSLLPYNVVEIGGFHIVEKPLNPEVKKFLDSAGDGAILFSLGSNLKSSDLSNETLNAILTVFGNLKQKVLWKFEKDFPDKPDNIYIFKWLKQSDVLSHPNAKLFITHGGMLSTTEAIFYGIPMVGIPIFADQKMNMARASKNGIATVVPFQQLSEKTLSLAIEEAINNTKYQKNARKMSNLMRDRIVKPLDIAMYWIEYVIRHKGTKFDLATLNLSWFQFYMLDFIILTIFIVLMVSLLLKCMFTTCYKKKECKTIHQKKNNKKKQH